MKNIVTKKRLLLNSGIITGVFLILDYIGTFRLCGGVEYGSCMDNLHSFFGVFIPILPLFLFSLITYKLPEQVYHVWSRFATWWVLLSMLLILIVPSYSGSLVSIDKGIMAFVTSALFIIISILIIILSWLKGRTKKPSTM